ncbi:MAG TPA: hypothetical protein VFC16_17875, partial [Nakamurella sp.]|nr:hypothetical protein [Nakamurella sp.]
GVLFVLDGATALTKAVRKVFGSAALIQRSTPCHYAEQRVMPSWPREALWDGGDGLTKSA